MVMSVLLLEVAVPTPMCLSFYHQLLTLIQSLYGI